VHAPRGGQTGRPGGRQEDKRLPFGAYFSGLKTQNVLHVIKFQVADNNIYVTCRTKLTVHEKNYVCQSRHPFPAKSI